MATTGWMAGEPTAEERRKRSRTDEGTIFEPELSAEIQAAIVERAKLGRRLPPKPLSPDAAKLLVSPRFKLITEMPGPISREILMAYANAMTGSEPHESLSFPLLMLFRVAGDRAGFFARVARDRAEIFLGTVDEITAIHMDRGEWRIAFLTGVEKIEKDLIIFKSLRRFIVEGRSDTARFEATKTIWGGPETKPKIVYRDSIFHDPEVVSDALIYGQTSYYPMISTPLDNIVDNLKTVAHLFWIDAIRFDRPSPGMLAMRDKIVVIPAAARPGHLPAEYGNYYHPIIAPGKTLRIDVSFYWTRETGDPDQVVQVQLSRRFGYTVEEISEDARERAEMTFATSGRPYADFLQPVRVRQEAVWPNGVRVELADWKRSTDEMVYGLPKYDDVVDAVRLRVEKMPEPALKSFAKHRKEWGYEMSMWGPATYDEKADGRGLLIMPAPWFFYLATKMGDDGTSFLKDGEIHLEGHFGLAKVGFWFRPHTVMLLTNLSHNIYAHQTHDLIFLPEEVDDPSVEELTLLRQGDVEERATVPLVEDGIELL